MRTLKKQIILGLAKAPDLDALKGNTLILVTPLGVISGSLCDENSVGKDVAGEAFLLALTKKLAEGFGKENIEGNDGYLLLSDVKVQTGGNVTYNLPHLVVFYDQIIGVTLGGNA